MDCTGGGSSSSKGISSSGSGYGWFLGMGFIEMSRLYGCVSGALDLVVRRSEGGVGGQDQLTAV